MCAKYNIGTGAAKVKQIEPLGSSNKMGRDYKKRAKQRVPEISMVRKKKKRMGVFLEPMTEDLFSPEDWKIRNVLPEEVIFCWEIKKVDRWEITGKHFQLSGISGTMSCFYREHKVS